MNILKLPKKINIYSVISSLVEAEREKSPEEKVIDEKVPDILEKMKDLEARGQEDLEIDELARRFETIEKSQTQDLPLGAEILDRSRSHTPDLALSSSSAASEQLHPYVLPAKFTNELAEFQYVDFIKRDDPAKYPTFRTIVSIIFAPVKKNF